MEALCTVSAACTAPELSRGMCRKHYQRWWKYGDPNFLPRHGPAPRGSKQRYLTCRINGREKYVHRIVWTEMYGPIVSGYVVHHVNGDTWDNCIENLELMTKADHYRLHREQKLGHQRE